MDRPPTRSSRYLLRRTGTVLQGILAALGLLMLVVTFTPLDSWWATLLAGPWNDPRGDVLVVLGGSILEDGTIGGSSYWRAVYGAHAWRDDRFKTIVVTGDGRGTTSAAEAMRDFMVSQGVPGDVITVETRSRSTRENALLSKPMLDALPGQKVLLTSDYHMFRAHRVFQKAGMSVLPRPIPDARKRANSLLSRWGVFLDLATETLKIGYYYLHGWL